MRRTRRTRGGKLLKNNPNCNTNTKIESSVKACLNTHERNIQPAKSTSIILVDTKTLGQEVFYPDQEALDLLLQLLLYTNISIENVYLFNDIKALYGCYQKIFADYNNPPYKNLKNINFVNRALKAPPCGELNRKLAARTYKNQTRITDTNLLVQLLSRLEHLGHAELCEDMTLEEVRSPHILTEKFNTFMNNSLRNITTPNLILGLWGHGERDGFILEPASELSISPRALYTLLKDPINTAGQIANLFIIGNHCEGAKFYEQFFRHINQSESESDMIAANIINIKLNTYIGSLPFIHYIQLALFQQTPYEALQAQTYVDPETGAQALVSDMLDKANYTDAFLADLGQPCPATGLHLSEIYSIIKSVVAQQLPSAPEILSTLRAALFVKYLESEGPILRDFKFWQAGVYNKHTIIMDQIQRQLVTTKILDDDLFVEHFNRLA